MLRVWRIEVETIRRLPRTVDRDSVLACVESLSRCRGMVATTGVGTSAAAARKIAHTLSCVERPAFFLSPADAPHGGLGALRRGDVAILVSKGGRSTEINSLLAPLRARKVFVIGVTEDAGSPLARGCDLRVAAPVAREADPLGLLATASTAAVVALFDAVAIVLADRLGGARRRRFARIHPGGAVGERLRERP